MKNGKKIVYTAGTWDLFHIGHLNILKQSFAEGDKLVVGVSTDELVQTYKKTKPVIPFEERKEIIESISFVDEVVPQHNLNDPNILEEWDIDIVTIGDDWKGKGCPQQEYMENNNIKLVYIPYTKHVSSTKIKNKITKGWQEDLE